MADLGGMSRSRGLAGAPAFAYLADEDRFLTRVIEPHFSFGFIGCGMMGMEHIRNAQLSGSARIGGLYDPAPRSVERALNVLGKRPSSSPVASPKVYRSLEEACADPDTDALIIATPNFTHLEVLQVAARYDKAIFLEKPIATTVDDAYEVCRIAAEHSAVVRVGLQYRYKAIYAEAIAEVFQRQSVGRVLNVNMLEHRFPFLDKVGQWNKFDKYTGGTLIEKCCHYFDLMNMFAGEVPQQVFAFGNQAVNFRAFNYQNEAANGLDQAQVVINYDNGVIGGFSLCMFAAGSKEELVVCGDAGRLHVSEQAQISERSRNHLEVWAGDSGVSRTSTPSYPTYISHAGHHGSTFHEHLAFVEDLERGTCVGPTLAEAFWSVVVGAAAQRSIEQGALVDTTDVLPVGYDATVFD